MAFLRLVVKRRAALHRLGKAGGIERHLGRQAKEFFGEIEEIAPVAIGHVEQSRMGGAIERQLVTHQIFGAGQQQFHRRRVEAVKHEDLGAGEECRVKLEGRVLGGRPDEDDGAVFDIWEEAILLGAVEAVDFVDEEQRPLPHPPPVARRLEHLPEVGNAGKDRREQLEMQIDPVGQQLRKGRLAAAGRTPEDHRRNLAGCQHAGDGAVLADEMVLADDVADLLRAQAVCEGSRCLGFEKTGHGFGLNRDRRCGRCRRGRL